ncbi:MAG: murein hydrolase activator EnvC family protein [Nitrospirota bacterium]
MNKIITGISILFLSFFSIIILSSPSSGEESIEKLGVKLKREDRRLERIENKIKKERDKKKRTKRKKRSLLSELENTDKRLNTYRKRLQELNKDIKKKKEGIDEIQKEIEELGKTIENNKGLIKDRMKEIYSDSNLNNTNAFFVDNSSYNDSFRKQSYLLLISKRDMKLIKSHDDTLNEVKEKEDELKSMMDDLLSTKNKTVIKIKEIRLERNKKDDLLASIKREERLYEKTIKELEASASNIESLIEKLKREKKHISKRERFAYQRGRLQWPNRGKIISGFGRQKHPKFDAYIYKKGIEIEGAYGDNIRAVFEGKVIYANWFKGYGLLLIIDHGNNYYTLYGHLSEINKKIGAKVKQGEIIGKIGDTGFSQVSSLYFEIRHKENAVNPLSWLKKETTKR